ncbi:MAG: PD40 domain-containing protein [Acidobacteria bacterium]|nr:PD40 domain-containing protein [Acidobacteriota bacterium]
MTNAPFRLEEWLIEPELNSLTAHGKSHHVEPKVMRVLVHLAEHPQKVLSKEEIIHHIWPDTFVSDDVLTRCISVLRRVMEDNPQSPRFIQTVPKAGYRLLAAVRPPVEDAPAPPSGDKQDALRNGTGGQPAAALEEDTSQQNTSLQTPPTHPAHGHAAPAANRRTLWMTLTAGIAVVLCAAILIFEWHAHLQSQQTPSFRTIAFASTAGEQAQASFSPDGNRLAYVARPERGEGSRIYIQGVGSETALPLVSNHQANTTEWSPVWSPDGKQIAFLAHTDSGLGIYLASATGNAEPRRIFIPQDTVHWDQNALSWSPDGKELLFADHYPGQAASSIYRLKLDSLSAAPMTSPPPGWEGDMDPAWSPDGRFVAFIRASESAVRDIYLLPASGSQPRKLTNDARDIDSITWSSDSNSVIFSSDRGGKFALWKVGISGGEPSRLPVGVEDAYQPAMDRSGKRLAYTQSSALWSISGIALRGNEHTLNPVISSTLQDSAPSFSPDGTHFAFQSWRSGQQEIWIANSQGTEIHQLTHMSGSITGSPAWSPTSDRILFDSRPKDHSHIFVIAASGGEAKQLTSGDFNDILPRWSANGRSVYFRSNRSGRWQIWKMNADGSSPQPVTAGEAIIAAESPDGAWLYYARAEESGIWRMPVNGGAEEKVLPQPAAGFWGYWALTSQGLYYLDASQKTPFITQYDPATRKSSRIATMETRPPIYSGISVSTTAQQLLMTDRRNVGSHITLVEVDR